MECVKNWVSEQWKEKKFRILTMIVLIMMICLAVEFYFFEYSIVMSIRYLYLLAGLFIIAWIDSKEKIIPNKILLVLLLSRVCFLLIECLLYKEYWMSLVISAASGFLIAGGMFLLCYFLTRGGVGAGDVKLFAVLGFYFGSGPIFTVVFLTIVYAAVYNIVKLVMKKTDLKQEIPFAPFIFLGTLTTMLLGM